MKKVLALLHAQWRVARSYRLNLVISFGGMFVAFVPLYFAANALQPMAADSIRLEGENYFAFLIIGIVVTSYLSFAMGSIPAAISSGIGAGTLEALLATPTRLSTLLLGLSSYGFLRTTVRALLLIGAMALVGGPVAWKMLPASAAIVMLIVLAHLPVGLAAAALHLVFRTAGPLVPAALSASTLLGGVYYSTTVIPEVIRPLSALFPLTYGLRALRRTLLSGEPISTVAGDLVILGLLAALLLAIGLAAFRAALTYARRAGTLAQY